MTKQRSQGSRLIALVIGALLICAGVTGLAVGDQPVLSRVGAAAAVLAGLFFLGRATRRSAT